MRRAPDVKAKRGGRAGFGRRIPFRSVKAARSAPAGFSLDGPVTNSLVTGGASPACSASQSGFVRFPSSSIWLPSALGQGAQSRWGRTRCTLRSGSLGGCCHLAHGLVEGLRHLRSHPSRTICSDRKMSAGGVAWVSLPAPARQGSAGRERPRRSRRSARGGGAGRRVCAPPRRRRVCGRWCRRGRPW